MNALYSRTGHLICILILMYALTACNAIPGAETSGDPNHTLSRELAERLFAISPTVEQQESAEIAALFCRVSEGTECYFLPTSEVPTYDFEYNPALENDAARLEDGLADEVVAQLDVNHIERAHNNTVVLHCRREGEALLTCTVNGGGEAWYPVRLE